MLRSTFQVVASRSSARRASRICASLPPVDDVELLAPFNRRLHFRPYSVVGIEKGESCIVVQQRSFSDNKGILSSITDPIKNTFAKRQERKREEKTMEQMKKLAQLETWNLSAFAGQMEEATSDWKTKIPGMSNLEQVKLAKETKRVLDLMISTLGANTCPEDMRNLGRKDKLKLAVACEIPLSDINQMIEQFENMEVMHSVLRNQYEKGKKIPSTEKEARALVMREAPKLMSKEKKRELGVRHAKAKLGGAMSRR
mmetsp:Transcript_2047/g.2738  ORF Transcript_2047/g.2738 Transcript_2047/m.2738 type:complete len:256 (-) Transcript_2047:174-941(-)